ncbi:Uma2 family endonuclease [Capnocytophaga granulosa]
MEITSINQLDLSQDIYTYADYLLWQFKQRVEILKGRIFKMAGANINHQKISRNLTTELYPFFKSKQCQLFYAPFDVVLPNREGKENTVVQPDLCVVCDPKKLADGKRGLGTPDRIGEILSPGNSRHDTDDKFHLYEEAGVSEYWIVRPNDKEVNIFILENGTYRGLAPIAEGKTIHSVKFPELSINTKAIFEE